MPELDCKTVLKPDAKVVPDGAEAMNTVFSLESRIEEAREKRNKVLAERRVEAEIQAQLDSSNPLRRSFAKARQRTSAILTGVSQRPTAGLVAKALFVFIGALGFGLGSMLGASAVSGSRPAPVVSVDRAEAALPLAEFVQPSVQSEADPKKVSISDVPKKQVAVPAILDVGVYDKLPDPPARLSDAPEFPEITNVAYVNADIAAPAPLTLIAAQGAIPSSVARFSASTLLPRVFLHAPDGIPERLLLAYVDELELSGVEVERIGREAFRISSTHVRFYSAEIAPKAQSLAAELGIEARDFSHMANNSKRIEVWVEGRSSARSTSQRIPGNFLTRVFQSIGIKL